MQAFPSSIPLSGGVVQASDGYFYGVSASIGGYVKEGVLYVNSGQIYRFAPGSKIEVVHQFLPAVDHYNIGGAGPVGPLVVGPDGALYGYTSDGGVHANGVIFRYELNGTFTPLSDLDLRIGYGAGIKHMIVSRSGDIYAVSLTSGEDSMGGGTLFRIRGGEFELLHNFEYSQGWQENDYVAPDHPRSLVEGADGRIYGTTTRGGIVGPKMSRGDFRDGPGVVFRLEEDGTLTFNDGFAREGDAPHYLIANPDGSFYGTNAWGVIRMSADMEVSQIWELTRLNRYGERIPTFHEDFKSERVILGSDGAFYFARQEDVWSGRIFKLTLQGELTPLHELKSEYFDFYGSGLTEGTDGFLYFISAWRWTPGAEPYSYSRSVKQYALAASTDDTRPKNRAFRLQIADPLNGDQPPLAVADHVILKVGKKEVKETSIDVLANDWDPDGDVLTLVSATKPQYGSVRIEAGILYYTPDDPKNIRTDECRYVVEDGRGGTASGAVTFRAPVKGRYSGKLKAVGGPKRSAATYAVTVAPTGKVAGRISIGNKTYPIKGQLGADDRIRGNFGEKKKKGRIVRVDLGAVFTPKRKLQGDVHLLQDTSRVTYQIR